MIRITDTVKHLIIINVLFFVATQVFGEQMYQWFALWFPKNENFQLWQLITHMFMHGSIGHIFFNMLVLWMFGSSMEDVWGKEKFIFFFISAGVGAALLQIGMNYYYFIENIQPLLDKGILQSDIINLLAQGKFNPYWYELAPESVVNNFISEYRSPSLGASGAIAGIMVAYAFTYPNRELMLLFPPIPIKAKYLVGAYFLFDLYSAITGVNNGIGYFAHVGGAVLGFLMMWYWKKNSFNKNRWN